ncbi:MAG: hypothetical protein A2W03_12010 [Candidatus Aminicenantes bacterium RBG_16_63_16]|nr:MAG: hypothetical protein A2W03_12010 [Candidatus Aminicenantes bacterium RBG_16_63_16]
MASHFSCHAQSSSYFMTSWVRDENNRKELDEKATQFQERRSRTTDYCDVIFWRNSCLLFILTAGDGRRIFKMVD